MTKRNKIIYWVATLWLALGMASTGIVQIMRVPQEIQMITGLGFPAYSVTFLGVCKLLGVVAILIPGRPLLKEWAYAGFFFNMVGAIYSHAMMGSAASELFGPSLLIVLIALSRQFRPTSRKTLATVAMEPKPETVHS